MAILHRLQGKIDGLYIVPGTPVLYIEKNDMIVFSDIHLGFEEYVARGLDYRDRKTQGYIAMFIPRIQLRNTLKVLDKVFSLIKPRRALVNGDLKHAFDRLLRQERIEVEKLLDYLLNKDVREIIVVRGNHDNYLPLVLKDYGIELMERYEIMINGYSILFTHGHKDENISGYDLVVIGHEHPSLKCFTTYKFPAFLRIPTTLDNEILVLPAMSAYHPGSSVSLSPETYLSPIIRKYGVLRESRVIIWFETEDKERGELEGFFTTENTRELINVSIYRVGGSLVYVTEFNDLETAMILCGF
jgi:putative SbcD/Mre11-related phosphoesterase